MTSTQNLGYARLIEVAKTFFGAYSAHDIDRMVSLCTPDMRLNYVPEGENGKGDLQAARGLWTMFTSLIPDFSVNVERIQAGSNFVVAETVQGGRPASDIGPIVAKGETTMSPHCYIIGFSDEGKIAEVTCYWDYNLIYAQLRHTEVHD